MRCKVPCRCWMPARLLPRCIFVFGALVLLAFLSVYDKTSADFKPESSHPISDHLHRRDVRDVEDSHVIGKTNDVHDLINKIQTARPDFFPDSFWAISMDKLATYLYEKSQKTDEVVLRSLKSDEMDNTGHWATLDRHIRQFSLYNPDDIALKAVLKDMSTLPMEETDGRTCFYGHCQQLCEKKYSFCGSPHSIEVSLMYFLPNTTYGHHTMQNYPNPWRPGGNKTVRAQLCNRTKLELAAGNDYLLNLHDAYYFDTLIDNFDRHSYAMYDGYNNQTVPILFDNGRSFGPPSKDVMLDYAKWHGCCLIKKTTFLKYLRLFMGPETLSELMRNSLRADPVDPVLPEDELMALDRRVKNTIFFIRKCLAKQSIDDVIINDLIA